MNAKKFAVVASLIVALIFAFGAPWQMQAQENKTPYPNMAPLDQYLMDRDAEIALARTAAPPSISKDATVMVLGRHPGLATLGGGFVSGTAQANGTTLHYVRGGTGSAVILLHGFPEDWYEYHRVMPLLAKQFTVVAVDLRGIGGSAATPDGYDAANMAEDVHQLVEHLHLEHVYIVGHDIGGMVAYAFARRYPETSRGVMLLDAPVPGLGRWDAVKANPIIWHIHFLDRDTFSDADVARYARAYAAPDHLRAALEIYRAFPANEKFNAAQESAISLPLVLAPGEHSPFEKLMPSFAEALRAHGCTNVKIEVIQNSVHYIADEQPEAVAELIERYASL
jgi:pimeloyl-ACP methyl ester carboxylesterase